MRIVVIGMGEVGGHLLKTLGGQKHDIVAVDLDPARIRYVEEHYDVGTIQGYGASHEVLTKAGAAEASLVVAVTNHDEANLIAALAARQLGAKRVIARVKGTEWTRWSTGIEYGVLGVDVVINPQLLVAHEFARIASSHGASEVIALADERIELVRVEVTEETRRTGKPIAQIGLPRGSLIAAVVRGGDLFIPGGVDVLLPGDRAYIIGQPAAVLEAEGLFSSSREARRVCIVGGGVIGEALARILVREGAAVMIIENNRERAERLSAELDRVTVVHGDGTDLDLLRTQEVDSFDLFVALTSADEVNLMAALLARQVKVPRTACVVRQGDHLEIYRQLGIDVALTPRLVASDHIVRYCRGSEMQSLTVLEDGKAEVVEVMVDGGCRASGVPVQRLSLPRGSLLAAIVHEGDVVIPSGDDQILPGDTAIVLTTPESRSIVERLFRSKNGG